MTLPLHPRVVLDTTVFCGALVNPDGLNFRILTAGAGRGGGMRPYHPIIVQTVIAEFIHKALSGLGRGQRQRTYTPEEIRRFLEALGDLFDQGTSQRLRVTYADIIRLPRNTPLKTVIWTAMSGFAAQAISSHALAAATLGDVPDLEDLHVMIAATLVGADAIVTANLEDFLLMAPSCQVLVPTQFADYLGL